MTSKTSTADTDDDEDEGIIQPFHSFVLSFMMIIFSEIGDKTFLVAALMAMRHPRVVVFTAAFAALITMTVLSAVLGHAVPTLLPKWLTSFAAAVLFFVFGAKLLREGLAMSPDEGVGEEMKEVEAELEEKEHTIGKRRRSSISPYALEAGTRGRRSRSNSRLPTHRSPSSSPARSPSPSGASLSNIMNGLNNLFSLLLSPAWVQTFVMTFLGEWGDRSQIATIAMAAGQDYWWVTMGAIVGHGLCTSAAVIGGRAIAGKVSMRVGKFFAGFDIGIRANVPQSLLVALSRSWFSASSICLSPCTRTKHIFRPFFFRHKRLPVLWGWSTCFPKDNSCFNERGPRAASFRSQLFVTS